MKEIKFRAYHIEKEKMINIKNLLSFSSDGDIWINENKQTPLNSFSGWVSKDFKLMQYTGLKDKNDVEIYEGDIVAWGRYTDEITGKQDFNGYGIVEYWSGDACYEISDLYGVTNGLSCTSYNEIIGNIYENKELLN